MNLVIFIMVLPIETDGKSRGAPVALQGYFRIAGRANVSFADVRTAARAALRHRLILSFEGQVDGVRPDSVVQEILDTIPQPETV